MELNTSGVDWPCDCKIKHKRCGRHGYNVSKGYCAACGYGRTVKIRSYNWQNKNFRRIRKY